MRYRLQRKETCAAPNILGNHSVPVYTYRWKDIAMCDEAEPLETLIGQCAKKENYRVIDTMEAHNDI